MNNNEDDLVVSALSVQMHKQSRNLFEVVITPEHDDRTESPEFRKSKEQLKTDGHFKCWVCGSVNDLQVHHYAAEWSLADDVDFDKLKAFCEEWDVYGYGNFYKDTPMTSVDDIRNMLVLCQQHHTGVDHDDSNSGTGIHSMTFPAFIMQKLSKKDQNPIPQVGQNADKIIEATLDKT